MNRNNDKKASRLVGAGLCLLTILAVFYFILVPERNFFNSDYADTLAWAKASVDARALFSHDFHYACLLPFGGHLLMIPFVALFGFSYAAHACGMMLFFLLLALALRAFFRAIGANTFWASIPIFCVFGVLCSSEKLREIYFGHILYYSLGGLFLLVGLTLLLSLDKDKDRKIPWRTIAFCVWCVLCSTDGLTSLTLFVLPLCAALAFERLCDREVAFFSAENFARSRPLFYALVSSIGGFGLGALLRNGFSAGYQTAFSTFSADTNWSDNLKTLFQSFLSLFTGDVAMYEPFTSFAGMMAAVRLLFGLLVMVVPFIALFFYKCLNRGEKLLLLSHFVVSATILFAFVFGLLSSAAWRLSPMVFTALIVTVMLARHLCLRPFLRRFGVLLLAFCVLVAGLGFFSVFSLPKKVQARTPADVARYLQERGYTYGYATFWDANAVTAMSGDRVKCRSIELDEESGFLSPSAYQCESSWYQGQGTGEKYFLLLSTAEYAQVSPAVLAQAVGTEAYNGYMIVTLPKDLFPLY